MSAIDDQRVEPIDGIKKERDRDRNREKKLLEDTYKQQKRPSKHCLMSNTVWAFVGGRYCVGVFVCWIYRFELIEWKYNWKYRSHLNVVIYFVLHHSLRIIYSSRFRLILSHTFSSVVVSTVFDFWSYKRSQHTPNNTNGSKLLLHCERENKDEMT